MKQTNLVTIIAIESALSRRLKRAFTAKTHNHESPLRYYHLFSHYIESPPQSVLQDDPDNYEKQKTKTTNPD